MLTATTKRKIDTARDILVGKIPMPTSQVEQITLALTYKFMSDMDKAAKELGDPSGFFANGYEKYDWVKLMDKALPARDRVKLYGEGLEKMALNPHIPQLFRDIFRNAFLPFNDPETLKLFLDTIDQFQYDHSEELGNAFEYLLQVMGSQGDAGQFRTPRHIIDFIVEVVDPTKTDKVLDPACGTAGFLISTYKHIKSKGLTSDEIETVSNNFVGYDISQDMQRLSLVNLYLHQFPDPHIYEYDTLTSEERWDDDFDVILANPPFMTPKGGIRPHNRFAVPSNRAEVLFVDYIMEHLTVNGKAGVIVPEGIIFQSQNAYTKLRKMMVDDDYLWAVASLPSGIFQPYAGVKTSVLLFDRKIAKKTNKVLFVKITNDGYDLGAQRRPIKQNDLPQALEILKEYKQGLIEGKEIELEDLDMAHVVEKKEIREGGYNLSSDRYIKASHSINSQYKFEPIDSLVDTVSPPKKLKKEEYKSVGLYPIIDQSQNEVAGYTNDTESILHVDSPLVIFGDHTCAVKYVEVNFAQGADGIKILRTNDYLHPKYLYYTLKYRPLESNGYQRHFSKLKRYEIPLPPLSVQQEIVEELDRYQKIIDGARQVVDNYQPSFKIEDDWEWVTLGSLCSIKGGKRLPKGVNYTDKETGYPYIRVSDFTSGTVNLNTIKYIEEETRGAISRYTITTDDVYISIAGTIGVTGVIPAELNGANLTENAAKLVIGDVNKLDNRYLSYVLQIPRVQSQIERFTLGVGVPKLALSRIAEIRIPLPSIERQKRLVSEIIAMNTRVANTRDMIIMYEEKIKSRIDDIWG